MAGTGTEKGGLSEEREPSRPINGGTDVGAAAPERRPSLPAETFGQGSPLDEIGSVPPADADTSAGSID